MGWIDYLILAVILGIMGLIVTFIVQSRKRGKKCIGCPDSGTCGQQCGNCSCGRGCGGQ